MVPLWTSRTFIGYTLGTAFKSFSVKAAEKVVARLQQEIDAPVVAK